MMTHATIDRVQKYKTPEHTGDGYGWGGCAMLAIDATVTDRAGSRLVRVAVAVGEGMDDHAIADALVRAVIAQQENSDAG